MMELPGYELRSLFQTTNNNLLFHAVRRADRLPVILKTPRTQHPGPRERARYQREHALLERLRGTAGVITAHGLELHTERPVLVLEDVGARALSEQLGQPFEPSRFLSIAVPLASILAEVHRRGVIHKDIKPANILRSEGGRVWLIDFGLASPRQLEHVEAAAAPFIEGTLPYMSPEQSGRMNRAVDYRTDFYSLGVVFYQLLTGQLPFRGRDALEWVHAHVAHAPVPPSRRVPSVPPLLSAVVLKLLGKAAEERYQSAEGLKADLERYEEGLRRGVAEEFPLGQRDFPARFQAPQSLYGRDVERQTLLESFERVARTGRTEWVLVRGYSGIGKSSVVHELHKPLLGRRGFFLGGKFNPLQRDVPYATLAQAMRALVQQMLAGSDEEVAAWRQRLLEAFEGMGQVLVTLVPQLEQVVGKQSPVPELPPADAQNRFNRLFLRFLAVFATAERPLVLFLDDLQWADFASLALLKYLTLHPDTPPLLLIGAYRDNEVSASHPLALTLAEARKAAGQLVDIHLGPLTPEQTRRLVTDALPGATDALVAPLSALVQEKTGGNPFFLLQLLQTLYQDGLVTRGSNGAWRWNERAVRARGYSDNVVEFMAGRLRQLPLPTQQLLRLAACVGDAFALETVALLSRQEASEVEQGLEPALRDGLLVETGAHRYRFPHDRIQQAAHALIAEEERKAVHLEIGRRLWSSLPPGELNERLFEVVGQLNAGAELISSAEERSRLARLNAEAGGRAKASVAYRSAIGYFTMAFSLLPGDPWETAPALAFSLRLDQATCELVTGHAAESSVLVEELLSRATTRPQLAAAYELKSGILLTRNQGAAAAACLLECLERFGVSIPPKPTWEQVIAAHQETEALLGNRPVESLRELPPMTDPDMKTVMGLLAALTWPAFFSDEKLLALQLCHAVALTLRHGYTAAAAPGYAWYGTVLASHFKDYQRGHAFSQLACELVESPDGAAWRGRTTFTMAHTSLWVKPIPEAMEIYHRAFQQTVQSGDYQVACYCCLFITTVQLISGTELAEVAREMTVRKDFARKVGYPQPYDMMRLSHAFVQQMRGLTASFDSLNMEDFDEKAFEAQLGSRMPTLRLWYAIITARSCLMRGAYEEARQAAEQAKALSWSNFGRIQQLEYHFYRALALAACYRRAPAERQPEDLREIQTHHQQLAEWARHCPETFRAPERMVAAELERILGRADMAPAFYEEAIQAAREQGFINHLALASELAARFWEERRVNTLALFYARRAREAYAQWGADGKARHMDRQWSLLTAGSATSQEDSTSYDSDSSQLDALTVVKAQQAISSEINLEKVVATLMRVALENAGAQRGALLLLQGGALKVEAVVDATRGSLETVSPEAAKPELPWTVLSYVRRAGEPVLINDTAEPHPFSADPYFSHSRARAVLCLPLQRQERVSGLLYLENALTTGAFRPGRITLLRHLASQAAISVENARLYTEVQEAETALRRANEELEQRVEERTRELKQAQARLVATARSVGMAEVASNVLHDVGNTLTSIVVDTEQMHKAVESSRVDRVDKVFHLLAEHRSHLSDFVDHDERGQHLFTYLPILASELKQERESLRQGLGTLGKNVERVRTIIQLQQTYATSTLLLEECELSEVLEEALRLQGGALRKAGVRVEKQFAPVRMKVDRHRLLQILLNLLSNAWQAMEPVAPGERSLWLGLHAEEPWVRIQVRDSGQGIAPEVARRLFNHGFTTRKEGHGIGLHSSALAARLMGGQLNLESAGPGQGAIATLELPLTNHIDG
ncbi:histidine kinase [Archangium sp. Cb G35]|uniref:trifunctional serine/threonine-protein kinase/ATP-binding protein/sensor histidine kinase n=1 Tax=Archangium sp. Cb G35 TaxID=1920190 RepID=UPI000936EA3E|nr:trifunctional serine/threonine-protein kinase/ATP-binding protein/sensor histidine kinase [Archangium sp. Cb G35]OJT24542.1 histidine kinase [Archangium sp. Cb G35]